MGRPRFASLVAPKLWGHLRSEDVDETVRNSKDAICLALSGRTRKADNHLEAVAELKGAGAAGRDSSTTLSRLLRLKTKSQYQAGPVSASEATKSIDRAARLLETAQTVTPT